MQFTTATLSNPGGRDENQDNVGFKILAPGGCWVLADGLGGHKGGAIASKIAVEQVLALYERNMDLSEAGLMNYLTAAQDAIVSRQEEDYQISGMRTTIVLLVSDGASAWWAHVGDSRLYHFRNEKIIFQTKDHSVPQAMANARDITVNEIRFHEDRNRLLRSLGKAGDLRPKIEEHPIALTPGDVFMLCTDGFWEYVTEPEMEKDLTKSRTMGDWLKRMKKRILDKAEKNHDNYSAIAIKAED